MKSEIYNLLYNSYGELSPKQMALNFLISFLLADVLYISYRISHGGSVYSRRFNVTLVMLTLITTLVMNVIGNNIALSLGMVGALSIVRFRTAVKDTRDTAYIFWAIAIGICCGVSDYLIAAMGTTAIFVFLVLFGFVKDNSRIILIIHMDSDNVENAANSVEAMFFQKAVIRLQTSAEKGKQCELLYELSERTLAEAEKSGSCLSRLSQIEGVHSVSFVKQPDEINQ